MPLNLTFNRLGFFAFSGGIGCEKLNIACTFITNVQVVEQGLQLYNIHTSRKNQGINNTVNILLFFPTGVCLCVCMKWNLSLQETYGRKIQGNQIVIDLNFFFPSVSWMVFWFKERVSNSIHIHRHCDIIRKGNFRLNPFIICKFWNRKWQINFQLRWPGHTHGLMLIHLRSILETLATKSAVNFTTYAMNATHVFC